MAEQSFIQVRIDNNLKKDAIDVLDEIGMDMPNAIRMFLKRVVLERGLPFDARLPAEITDDNTSNVEVIPAKPSTFISNDEWIGLLCTVPEGKITRIADIEAYFCKKYNVSRITLDQSPMGYNPNIPYWRIVSTRGMLQDTAFHCSKEAQKTRLEQEGLTVIPCGAHNKSLKVENYREHLYRFDPNSSFAAERIGEANDR